MVILDQNRSIAATLSHNTIDSLVIEDKNDIGKIREMIENGELFDFKRTETDLFKLKRSFIAYCLKLRVRENDGSITFYSSKNSTLRYVRSVKERVDDLIKGGELPSYIVQ